MSTDARREDEDGVVYVTFTRPEKRNAISRAMFSLIRDAVADLRDQDHLRVLVIGAEGDYFTGGKDVADLRTNVGEGTDGIVRGSNIRSQYRVEADHDLFDAIEQVEKPVVLAAQGHCLGVGIEMGASCDFRLAAEGATFGLPEVENLAVLPGSGGISRLTRLVGPHWARWLAMACETVDAHQALAIGLVHAVYPRAEFPARVRAFARRLASMPREALGVAKVAIDVADTVDRGTSRIFDRFAQTRLFSSDDFKARVDAFNRASAARQQARAAPRQ
ncbi:MAG TPA: enoyl-CoA hydratase/isomerase family protein [Acidimicrobiales bacterium]|nr:enoyl-CoA hydratase/isomerase family protein [Acidimicrobiales bacterium]